MNYPQVYKFVTDSFKFGSFWEWLLQVHMLSWTTMKISKVLWTSIYRVSRSLVVLAVLTPVIFSNSLAQTKIDDSIDETAAKVAYGIEFVKEDQNRKLILKFDGKPDTRVFLMDTPKRLVLELKNAAFNIKDELPPEASDLIGEMRSGAVTSNNSRLVVTLVQPIEIVSKLLIPVENSVRYNLELSFKAASPEVFSKAIEEQQELLGSSGEAVVKGDRVRAGPKKAGTFTVVIDPGHGGIDGGSVGQRTKILEKDLTLRISKLLGDKIEALGPIKVNYTRTEDVFVSLKERQRFAQRLNADLMISIHADSLKQLFVRGATVYTLAKKATDALSQSIADSENLADVVAGLAAPEAQEDVTDILADLTLRETTRFSRRFSSLLVNKMQDGVKMIKNPQRAASFAVLKNAEIPSVLLELGYLSNEEDEKLLANPDWQEKTTSLIAKSVKDFFLNRQPHANPN